MAFKNQSTTVYGLNGLARELANLSNEFEVEAVKFQKEYATQALKNIVTGTPIKTGRAKANWNVSLGTPNFNYDWKAQGGAQALSRGAVQISRIKLDQTVYISNGLPYINRLNAGWSQQAPAGFVEYAEMLARVEVTAKFGRLK